MANFALLRRPCLRLVRASLSKPEHYTGLVIEDERSKAMANYTTLRHISPRLAIPDCTRSPDCTRKIAQKLFLRKTAYNRGSTVLLYANGGGSTVKVYSAVRNCQFLVLGMLAPADRGVSDCGVFKTFNKDVFTVL
jgi:hypothetical protein